MSADQQPPAELPAAAPPPSTDTPPAAPAAKTGPTLRPLGTRSVATPRPPAAPARVVPPPPPTTEGARLAGADAGSPTPVPDLAPPTGRKQLKLADVPRGDFAHVTTAPPPAPDAVTPGLPPRGGSRPKSVTVVKKTAAEPPPAPPDAGAAVAPAPPELRLTPGQLWLVGGSSAAALLLGLLVSWPTALPAVVLAGLLGAGLTRLGLLLRLPRGRALLWLGVGMAVLHLLLVFAVQPLWQYDRGRLGQGLIVVGAKLDGLLSKADTRKKTDAAEPAAGQGTGAAQAAVNSLAAWTDLSLGRRLLLFCQLLLLTGAVLWVPVIVTGLAPGLAAAPAAGTLPDLRTRAGAFALQAFSRFGSFALVRLAKAVLMTLLTAVGFAASGLPGWWCLAVAVGVAALVVNVAPALAAGLGVLLLWAAPSLPRAIVGVVLTTAVLALAEGRLRWYLQLVPQAKRYHLPPELLQARSAGDGLGAKLAAIVPSLISVVIVLALGFFVYQFIEAQTQHGQRESQWRAGRQALHEIRTRDAVKIFAQMLTTDPDDWEASLGLIEAHLQLGKYADALVAADALAAWTPMADSNALGRLRQYFIDLGRSSPRKLFDPACGYEAMLRELAPEDVPKRHDELAERLGKLDPASPWYHYGKALAALHRADFSTAAAAADRGLAQAPRMLELLVLKAEALLELKRLGECVQLCDRVLALDQDHKQATALRLRAAGERALAPGTGAQDAPPPPPDAAAPPAKPGPAAD